MLKYEVRNFIFIISCFNVYKLRPQRTLSVICFDFLHNADQTCISLPLHSNTTTEVALLSGIWLRYCVTLKLSTLGLCMENNLKYRSPLEQTWKERQTRKEEFSLFLRERRNNRIKRVMKVLRQCQQDRVLQVNSLGTEIHTLETKHYNTTLFMYFLLPLNKFAF